MRRQTDKIVPHASTHVRLCVLRHTRTHTHMHARTTLALTCARERERTHDTEMREILAEELQLDALDGEEGQKVLGIDLKTLRRSSFLSRALFLYVCTFVCMYIRMSVYACMS